jgi:uncharacterized membrane protein
MVCDMKVSQPRVILVIKTLLALLYAVAGVLHIVYPAPFLTITPAWVPYPATVIFITGLCEIAGATGLFIPQLRKAAGLGLALYAIAVFPANINHAMQDMNLVHPVLGLLYHIPRLAFQPVLVWAALFAAGITKWPFKTWQ